MLSATCMLSTICTCKHSKHLLDEMVPQAWSLLHKLLLSHGLSGTCSRTHACAHAPVAVLDHSVPPASPPSSHAQPRTRTYPITPNPSVGAASPPQPCLPRTGTELTISYGDKSNEQLLMLYGFATPDNPHEQLMIPCPLPPKDAWGEDIISRLQLLQARGLKPQVFLSAAYLAQLADGAPGRQHRRALTPEVRRVLEVFVYPPEEVARRLELLEQQGVEEEQAAADGEQRRGSGSGAGSRAGGSAGGSGGGSTGGSAGGSGGGSAGGSGATERVERLGEDMALITTLVRLLELRVLELEAEEEGTGPLEADEARLVEGAGKLAPWLSSCLLYRVGQKRLARGYLAVARRELQTTLGALQAAMEAEEQEQAKK